MTDETTNVPESTQEGTETEATQTEATESTLDTEGMRKELERARKEAAKYRTRAKSLEEQHEESKKAAERAKMDEVEAAKAEANDLKTQLEAARQEAKRNAWKASLTGKVANTDAALKLLDPEKHVTDTGDIDVDAFLKEYDFLTPNTSPAPTKGAGGGTKRALTIEDFRGKSQEWIIENRSRLKQD